MTHFTCGFVAAVTVWATLVCCAAQPAEIARQETVRVLDSVEVQGEGRSAPAIGLIEVTTRHAIHADVSVTTVWIVQAAPGAAPDWSGARRLVEIERLPIVRRLGDPKPVRLGALAFAPGNARLYALEGAVVGDGIVWQVNEYDCEWDTTARAAIVPTPEPGSRRVGRASAAEDGVLPQTMSNLSMAIEDGAIVVCLEADAVDGAGRVERSVRVELDTGAESRTTIPLAAEAPVGNE